jgi:hypothetical protein
MRVAFSSIDWNTGFNSPGELLITRRTSEVAVCCSSASASFFSRSARDSRVRLPRVLAFVPVERIPRACVLLFAPLRDKVTSSAQSLVPFRSGSAKDRACQYYRTMQKPVGIHSITSSARASSIGGTSRPRALAALRLIANSYLVGACTGRSAGFSPLRMRST